MCWSSIRKLLFHISVYYIVILPSNGKLETSSGGPWDGLLFRFSSVFSSFSSSHVDVLIFAALATAALTEIYFQTEPVSAGQAKASTTANERQRFLAFTQSEAVTWPIIGRVQRWSQRHPLPAPALGVPRTTISPIMAGKLSRSGAMGIIFNREMATECLYTQVVIYIYW